MDSVLVLEEGLNTVYMLGVGRWGVQQYRAKVFGNQPINYERSLILKHYITLEMRTLTKKAFYR